MSFMSQPPLANNVLLGFESGLRDQHRELARAIEKRQKEIRALADFGPGDVMDASSGNARTENMLASYSQIRTQLRKIERALQRISTGDFGICSVCEDPIGLKRLQAAPWATSCIQCQEQSEQGRAH
jgi:RNA polymerase-binding transcription factor